MHIQVKTDYKIVEKFFRKYGLVISYDKNDIKKGCHTDNPLSYEEY
jgi:hypothetical protein